MVEHLAADKPAMAPRVIGRYALFGEIAAGGMATVHFGRLVGPVGFSRTVAIKRLHAQYAKDPEFVAMFLDEARLASRIQHPNVVTTLDVVNMPHEVFLVMEYLQGESLSRLIRNARKLGEMVPPGHAVSVIAGMLHGLHAAHEAKSERREALNIVHRDVSPQNVLVGVDGAARVLDFGVAKAAMRSQSTRDGQMKGKLSYMSPEQLNGKPVDRRTDLFAAGVVLWEALTGRRLFDGADAGEIFAKLLASEIARPSSLVEGISPALDDVVMKALERDPDKRHQTARQFAIELEGSTTPATPRAIGEWVEHLAGFDLERRAQMVAEIESISTNPEDLAKFDEDFDAELLDDALVERQSVSSAVRPATGSRPRVPPLALAVRRPDGDEPSYASSAGASTSQVTSLAGAVPPSNARSSVFIGALAACLGGGAVAFFLFSRQAHDPAYHPVSAAERPAVSAPSGSAHTAPPTETVHIQDLPPAPPDEEPKVPVDPVTHAPLPTQHHSTKPASTKPVAVPANACNPPFTVDANGIKRLKPGCL
ncbi:MAG TPA: protein kinase [Polyangiaceae bacterium]|jgi:serine/threonine-protein kinase|nr:protein kinase [Polyangiaceae bacterium]